MKKKTFLKLTFLLLVAAFNLTACYRMPYNDEYSIIPSTNNPDLTREKSSNNFMPNMGF